MVCKRFKEKSGDNKSWWNNKCHDRWSISCFIRINAQKKRGWWTLSNWIPTNLACRILRRPFHSIACSSPRFYKDCKCQHTSRQSEKWQGRERWSKDDPWAANVPQAQARSDLPFNLTVPSPYLQRPPWRASLGNSTYSPPHKTFIQNSHFTSVRRREESPSKDMGLPGGDLEWAGQGKLWPGSFCCSTRHGQGGHRAPNQAWVRSLGPHLTVTTLADSIHHLNCVFAFIWPYLCVSVSSDCQPGS